MQKKYFLEKISEMQKTYGAGSYPDLTVKALWSLLRHVTEQRFEKAITRLFADNPKYPFGIAKIEDVLADIRDENYEREKQKRSNEINSRSLTKKEIELGFGEIIKNFGR